MSDENRYDIEENEHIMDKKFDPTKDGLDRWAHSSLDDDPENKELLEELYPDMMVDDPSTYGKIVVPSKLTGENIAGQQQWGDVASWLKSSDDEPKDVILSGVVIESLETEKTFARSNLDRATFDSCKLRSNFANASLRNTVFSDCELNGCKFAGADLANCEFRDGTNLWNVDFRGAKNVNYANFAGAKGLQGALFDGDEDEDLMAEFKKEA